MGPLDNILILMHLFSVKSAALFQSRDDENMNWLTVQGIRHELETKYPTFEYSTGFDFSQLESQESLKMQDFKMRMDFFHMDIRIKFIFYKLRFFQEFEFKRGNLLFLNDFWKSFERNFNDFINEMSNGGDYSKTCPSYFKKLEKSRLEIRDKLRERKDELLKTTESFKSESIDLYDQWLTEEEKIKRKSDLHSETELKESRKLREDEIRKQLDELHQNIENSLTKLYEEFIKNFDKTLESHKKQFNSTLLGNETMICDRTLAVENYELLYKCIKMRNYFTIHKLKHEENIEKEKIYLKSRVQYLKSILENEIIFIREGMELCVKKYFCCKKRDDN